MLFRDKSVIGVCASVMVMLCVLPSLGATNPQITRLMNEKNQKMAKLEQCAKKVNGFKIAGISTLGLTAAGVAGNVVLSGKKKGLETELASTQKSLESEEKKKSELETKIAAEEKRIAEEKRKKELEDKKSECDAQPNKEWKNEKCVDKVQVVTSTVSETPVVATGMTQEECEKDETKQWKDGECVDKEEEGGEETPTIQKTSLEVCLEERANMSAEAKACCYVGKSVAKWDGKQCKCTDDNKKFDVTKRQCVAEQKTVIGAIGRDCSPSQRHEKGVYKYQNDDDSQSVCYESTTSKEYTYPCSCKLVDCKKPYKFTNNTCEKPASTYKDSEGKWKTDPSYTCCDFETWMIKYHDLKQNENCICVNTDLLDVESGSLADDMVHIKKWAKQNGEGNMVCGSIDHNSKREKSRQCFGEETDKFYEFRFKK